MLYVGLFNHHLDQSFDMLSGTVVSCTPGHCCAAVSYSGKIDLNAGAKAAVTIDGRRGWQMLIISEVVALSGLHIRV